MDTQKVIKSWLDRSYRNSLSKDEQSQLPAHPAGVAQLSDLELAQAVGGDDTNEFDTTCCYTTQHFCTWDCPSTLPAGCE